MEQFLYLGYFTFLFFSYSSRIWKWKKRIGFITTLTKLHLLFGFFTRLVNSDNSRQCIFKFLPPTPLVICGLFVFDFFYFLKEILAFQSKLSFNISMFVFVTWALLFYSIQMYIQFQIWIDRIYKKTYQLSSNPKPRIKSSLFFLKLGTIQIIRDTLGVGGYGTVSPNDTRGREGVC